MACRFEATIPSTDPRSVSPVREALTGANRLEDQLSIFRATSEVSFINATAATRAVRVEPGLFRLLVLSPELWRETDGAFDITSGPLSDCWGFQRRRGRLPQPSEIEQAQAAVGADKLILDRQADLDSDQFEASKKERYRKQVSSETH